jgi:DNA polymerase-1
MQQGKVKVCAIDTETHLIEPGRLAPMLVCLSWCDGERTGLLHRNETRHRLKEFLNLRTYKIVGHNIAFDMAVLGQCFPDLLPDIFTAYEEGRIEDTLIREQLIDIADGCFRGVYRNPETDKASKREYSLQSIAERRLNVELEKDDWRLRYAELTNVPIEDWPAGAKDYARTDAQVTYEIFAKQEPRSEVLKNSAAQARAAFALHLMSCWGVITDRSQVEKLKNTIEDNMAQSESVMREHGLIRTNGTKNLKLIRELVAECLGKSAPKTNKGSIKTDDKTLEKCDHVALKALSQYKAAEKINSTWVHHLERGVGEVVQPTYNVLVETGRTSCRNPNIQNPHRTNGLRECFIPRKGFLYAACDYSSLEMCTLAQACIWLFGESALANAINSGIDPHLRLAAQILAIDYDTAKERIESGDKEIRKVRQLSKAANFGYPGGMGPASFMSFASGYGIHLTLKDSTRLRNSWFDAWPEMRKYFDYVTSVSKHPQARLKQFVSERYRGAVRFTSACNSYFQGLAADGAKAAVYGVVRQCYTPEYRSPLFGSRPVMFIHDEIIAEVPERNAAEAAEELSRIMRETMQTYTPDVKIGTSVALMRRWYKDAEEVRDNENRLAIWESSDG